MNSVTLTAQLQPHLSYTSFRSSTLNVISSLGLSTDDAHQLTRNLVPLQGPKKASPRVALELAFHSLDKADLRGGVLQHCFLSTSELKRDRTFCLIELRRGKICFANFIPPANGGSLGSYLVKIDFYVKKDKSRLTKIAQAAKLANLS